MRTFLPISLLMLFITGVESKRNQQMRAHHLVRQKFSKFGDQGYRRIDPIVEMDEEQAGDLDLADYIDSILETEPSSPQQASLVTPTTIGIEGPTKSPNDATTSNATQGMGLLRLTEVVVTSLFILFLLLRVSRGDATSDTEIIKKLLNKGYDWRVRPPGVNLSIPGSHGPVIVAVNMLIRSISKIDDVNMEYSVQMTFRENWVDGRLAYGLPGDNLPDFLILTAGQQIWMPDSFFQNEKMAQKHMIDKPNVLIRIHKDGRILYSVRISMVLSCPMHLRYYPMDVQTCYIDLASYAYTTEDIEYVWKDNDPVQLKEGLESSLPSFQLNKVSTDYCTSKTNTGTYSCLRTILELKRQFSYYLLQLYVPSTMLVIVSWVSFWLDRTAVPARVTLGVTTLLTMTTQASGINAKLPPVSYTKAIDVWIGACLTFIFGALLEFAWVTYISSRNFHRSTKMEHRMSAVYVNKNQAMVIQNSHTADVRVEQSSGCESEVWVKQGHDPSADLLLGGPREPTKPSVFERFTATKKLRKFIRNYTDMEDKAKRADLVSRVLFPVAFVLFNILYWTMYSSSGPQ